MTIWTAAAPTWTCVDERIPRVDGQAPPAAHLVAVMELFVRHCFVALFFVSALLLSSCGGKELAESIRFGDPEPRHALAERLHAEGLAFTQSPSGAILYRFQDRDAVNAIVRDIQEHFYPPNAVSYSEDGDSRKFAETLSSTGIKNRLLIRGGRLYVVWLEADDARVRDLLKQFDRASLAKKALEDRGLDQKVPPKIPSR